MWGGRFRSYWDPADSKCERTVFKNSSQTRVQKMDLIGKVLNFSRYSPNKNVICIGRFTRNIIDVNSRTKGPS